MFTFKINKQMARLALLQRIELANPLLKKLRKFFGRYIFTNFLSKYFINEKLVGKNYFDLMNEEFLNIEKFIEKSDKLFLSIGGGLGGLEAIINKKKNNTLFYFIEKNYISKKVKYGWDDKNLEGYNNLNLQKNFLINNGFDNKKIEIIDFDLDSLPIIQFDFIISLLSLDYHYDFNIYFDYLKKVSNQKTKIIFDTVRVDYFERIFKHINIIKTNDLTVHKSKRIICREFLI
tara:strand:- start:380 stop:1078 length:699 start_codon:yes stop_codon:yes gene_type:complete